MEISDSLIDKLAMLSRIQFNSVEKAEIKKDMQNMIGFIDKLNELDTSEVKPLLHMSEHVNVLRVDTPSTIILRKDVLLNSPHKDDEFFKVPKVIKKNG